MSENYWEKVVYSEAPLTHLQRQDVAVAFGWLQRNLPVGQTKIIWSSVNGSHSHWALDDAQLHAAAVREVCTRLRPDALVEHVGDGLSQFGVRFGMENAPAVVRALLEIPEHHYFLAEDRSWLVVVTTEGDLDVLDIRE